MTTVIICSFAALVSLGCFCWLVISITQDEIERTIEKFNAPQ